MTDHRNAPYDKYFGPYESVIITSNDIKKLIKSIEVRAFLHSVEALQHVFLEKYSNPTLEFLNMAFQYIVGLTEFSSDQPS